MHWPGEKIRREREARGLSQAALAHLLSAAQPDNTVSVRSVTAWENNESRPSGRNLAALDRVLTPHDDGPSLHGCTNLQLLAELARRLGGAETGLPDTDLRLPRRHRNHGEPHAGGQ